MSNFKGVGVLILESYRGFPVITLFGRKKKIYADAGGFINYGETTEHAAHRELREKTSNLIYFKPEEISNLSIPIITGEYICYLIYIRNLRKSDYKYNNRLLKTCSSKSWKENNSMARFNLQDIIIASSNRKDYCRDICGKNKKISERTTSIIRRSYPVLNILLNKNPYQLHRHKISFSRIPCLISTYTYKLTSTQQAIVIPEDILNQVSIYPSSPSIDSSSISSGIDLSYVSSADIGLNTLTQTMFKYAIFIAPDLSPSDPYFLKACNRTWGGMHISLVGFSNNHPVILKHMQTLSFSGSLRWTINPKTIYIHNNTIYFKSGRLDDIADYLYANGFDKVHGPRYSGVPWYMTSECPIPTNISFLLKDLTWSMVLIKLDGGVRWMDRLPLTMN